MNKKNIIISILAILAIFTIIFCYNYNTTPRNATNSLRITKAYEKTIQEYIDTSTYKLGYPEIGKMYSTFKVLGTDKDRIYIWISKAEFYKEKNKIKMQNCVIEPIVLYVKVNKNTIKIKSYKFSEDGESNGKSMRKLFPKNILEIMDKNYATLPNKLFKIMSDKAYKDLENAK